MIATHKAGKRQFKRRRQALADQFYYRLVELERLAEVAGHRPSEKVPILHDQRSIQAPFVARPLDIRRRGVVAEQETHRIARRDMHQ